MISTSSSSVLKPELLADSSEEPLRLVSVWNGILHEFRNHLTVLMAAANELRAEIPPTLALQIGEALGETERSVEGLTSLVALVDASVRVAEPVVCDLDEVLERAVRLAAPAVGRRVSLTVARGAKTGIKNRGSALECLLAVLVVDLARATSGAGPEARAPRVRLQAEVGRAALLIEIDSDGPRPAPGSWRYLLARELALKLGAQVLSAPDQAVYLVQFR